MTSAGLLSLVRGSSLRAQLLRGGAGSLLLKIANMGLRFGVAIVLARALGANNYGIYTYVFALVSLLAIPAEFGLSRLVVRETAKAEANRQWALMHGLWRWASLCAGAFSLLLAVIGASLAFFFSQDFSAMQLAAFAWGITLVPLLALGSLREAALLGLRKVVQGQLPEQFIRPALLILLILAVGSFAKSPIAADQAVALHALAAAIAFAIGAWLLYRERPKALASKPVPEYETKRWRSSVLPFALMTGVTLINERTDILMLGLFGSPAQAIGVYRIAQQGAMLAAFAIMPLGRVTGPHFARLYAQNELAQLRRLATADARACFLLSAPAALVLIFLGRDLLRIVFGAQYAAGYLPLAILVGAHLLKTVTGSTAPLLSMSGHECVAAKCVAMATACNILLNAFLIPIYGITGAAIATATAILIREAGLWIMVRRRLGVDSSVFGIFHALNSAANPRDDSNPITRSRY